MGFTKEPTHVKKYTKQLKNGLVKTYTYDNKVYNNNSKEKNIMELCRCGKMIRKFGKPIHIKTKKHLFLTKDMGPPPTSIRKIPNALILCDCGAIVKKYNRRMHRKTKKHLTRLFGDVEE